jgi:hypothetical protein
VFAVARSKESLEKISGCAVDLKEVKGLRGN